MLHAALQFWQPDLHVFWLSLDEIGQTNEDFSSILEMESRDSQALPGSLNLVRENLASMLGLHKVFARRVVVGEKVDLRILINYFIQ